MIRHLAINGYIALRRKDAWLMIVARLTTGH